LTASVVTSISRFLDVVLLRARNQLFDIDAG